MILLQKVLLGTTTPRQMRADINQLSEYMCSSQISKMLLNRLVLQLLQVDMITYNCDRFFALTIGNISSHGSVQCLMLLMKSIQHWRMQMKWLNCHPLQLYPPPHLSYTQSLVPQKLRLPSRNLCKFQLVQGIHYHKHSEGILKPSWTTSTQWTSFLTQSIWKCEEKIR